MAALYEKIASEVVTSATSLRPVPFLLGTGGSVADGGTGGLDRSAGATSRSDRTLTVAVKFDEQKLVRDYAYHASPF